MEYKNFSGHGTRIRASAAELRLLVRILAKDDAGTARCLKGCPELINRLADTCNRCGLSVVLLRALDGSPLRSALQPHQIDLLTEALKIQKERLERFRPALTGLAGRFEADGMPFILLKGPYLASRFYGDILGREYVDMDLLVPARCRTQACALLESAGFHRYSGILLHERLTRFFVHAFDFRSGRVCIDLHWNLSRHIALRLDEAQLWSQHSSFSMEGRSYCVLSDRHEVIFAALSLLRDTERARPKPKNIIDIIQIAAAVDAQTDWDVLFSARDGTAGPLAHVLRQCLEITDAADLVPNLAAALERHHEYRLPVQTSADSPLQFQPALMGIGNKLWAAHAYDTNLPACLFWWALSLPFRLAVHRKPPRR